MTLHTKILDAARDEVARKHGFSNFKGVWSMGISYPVIVEEAALLAMDRQAEFYRHIFFIGWKVVDNIDGEPIYEQGKQSPQQTELELYEIWEGQK